MTRSTTPSTPGTHDRKLVKDVAVEIERRRRRRRLVTLVVILGLVIVAALYLTCGKGWGLGGKGKGAGPGSGPGSGSSVAAPTRCTLRVTKDGVLVDGVAKTRDQAVDLCKHMKDGAVVTVTGDARQGDWDELRAALEAVGVKIYMRGQESDGVPPKQTAPH
jgi:hypothetical protein